MSNKTKKKFKFFSEEGKDQGSPLVAWMQKQNIDFIASASIKSDALKLKYLNDPEIEQPAEDELEELENNLEEARQEYLESLKG